MQSLADSTLEQLKAMIYDQIISIEQSKINIRVIEEEMNRRKTAVKLEVKKDDN